jgi:hypothetical protein
MSGFIAHQPCAALAVFSICFVIGAVFALFVKPPWL